MKSNVTVLWRAIGFHQSVHPGVKHGALPHHSAKSMEVYDLLAHSFILQHGERKGGGVFLSSRLEFI